MENPNASSPKEPLQGQESTAAGPSGTHDADEIPITIQGDNFSNPSEFTNENSQLGDPSSIISRKRASELDPSIGLAEGRQTDGEGPSILSPESAGSEVGVSRGLSVGRQTDGTELSSPELAENFWLSSILVHGVEAQQAYNPRSSFSGLHDGFLFVPRPLPPPHGYRNVRQRVLVPQRPLDPQMSRPRSPAGQSVHPESAIRAAPNISSPPPTFQPFGTPAISLPAQALHARPSFPPGNYNQRGMLPQGPRPHGAQFQPGTCRYYHIFSSYRSLHPSGYLGMPPGMPAYLRGFPLHNQAPDNRPTAPPVVRSVRPQPRRGRRTASISQLLRQEAQNPSAGRHRGRWRAPLETPGPPPLSSYIPSSDNVVKADGRKCPVCDTDAAFPVLGGDDQPGVLPATTLLPCGHLFHADCLDRVTPEGCSEDTPPPCIACRRGDEK